MSTIPAMLNDNEASILSDLISRNGIPITEVVDIICDGGVKKKEAKEIVNNMLNREPAIIYNGSSDETKLKPTPYGARLFKKHIRDQQQRQEESYVAAALPKGGIEW